MKLRRTFLKATAIIVAFSVALTSERAAFGAVIAAPSFGAKSIDKNISENEWEGDSEKAETSDSPDASNISSDPNNPEEPGNPDNPDNPDDPDNPDEPDNSDNPDDPHNPGMPEDPVLPMLPEEIDSVSENDLFLMDETEEEGIVLLAEGDYGTVTANGDCGDQGDNLTWAYYADTETVVISRRSGSGSGTMASYGTGGGPWKSCQPKHLVVEEGVESIGSNAFWDCADLTGEVRLSAALTTVGGGAFQGDKGITKVSFEAGEAENRSLTFGRDAFSACSGLETIDFPGNLTGLQMDYFAGCTQLKELTIPGSLAHVTATMGFQYMSSLEKIIVEEGINAIDNGSIPKGSLQEISLPSTLTGTADSLFNGAGKLEKVLPHRGGA